MAVKRSLGRGLNELLSAVQLPELKVAAAGERPRYLPVDLLQPGKYQPRKKIQAESLQELADSIRAQGILQPLLVRPIDHQRYEIIAGERRWRASQLAMLEQVPVFIRDISNEAAIAMGLIENIQREDLNAIEQAVALKRLGDEFNLTHEDIAAAVGKSRVSISNLLRLLNLEVSVRLMLENGELEMGHARALLSLQNERQLAAAKEVVAKDLSVRDTEFTHRHKN
jgi:ParB family chromosome partitioning protein